MASQALAEGKIVSPKAGKLMAKTPIPFMPFTLWRWLFIKRANQHWRSLGAVNQVGEVRIVGSTLCRS
ncbi:MAG: hypothetical protein AB4372_28895 [Xenococcus sp. (in: cyanobacteria)]